MAHAVEMILDDTAAAAVREQWDRLAAADLPSLSTRTHRRHIPHVSLAVADAIDPAALDPLRAALGDRWRLHVHFGGVGLFPGEEAVLFVAVTPTRELLAVHAEAADSLEAAGVAVWAHYGVGRWVPHCTLAQDLSPPQVPAAVAAVAGWTPLTGQIERVALTDTETGEVTNLVP